jgi:hypothetical protein
MEYESQRNYQESQTTLKEINELSHTSLHFDKEEVKFLYYNLNCNFLKVKELLDNIPSQRIKDKIEAFEARKISKAEFVESMNKLIIDKLAEEEQIKKKVKLCIEPEEWTDVVKSNSGLFGRLSKLQLVAVCQFLDVYSLYSLSLTEKYFYKLEKTPAIYKTFCAAAFNPLPQASFSVYNDFVGEIKALSAFSIDPHTKQAILNDVRRYIWGKDPSTIKTSKKYFMNSLNFRETFFSYPRLRFDGYFYCTETYFRKGQADMTGFYVPIHYIKSYRYLRFFDSGLVLYVISTKKFSEEIALKVLTIDAFHKNKELRENRMSMYLGEYIVSNDKLSIKMPDKTWVNEMVHVMKLGTEKGYTMLQIVEHQMRDIASNSVHQMERDMKDKDRIYYFKRVPDFIHDIVCSAQKALYGF